MNKKILIRRIVLLMLMCFLTGCSKEKRRDAVIEPVETSNPLETPDTQEKEPIGEETHEGEQRSRLTGLWMDSGQYNKRPYAIMFNNIKYANPQSGISQASILYEALVEGGITRMMGIFEDLEGDRFGSVRSARHYFVSFADVYDAIFVHFGQTKYALDKMVQLEIQNLSGLEEVGNQVFYRDKSIKAPHNAFASLDGIMEGTKGKKYRTEYRDDFEGWNFYEEERGFDNGFPANKVTLSFSDSAESYFDYNKEEKLYNRFQFGQAHIDNNTKEQLSFKNIIILFVKEWNIDRNGYQTMDIENTSGDGYYISNGKAMEIIWKKNESSKELRYHKKNGEELIMNPGKIYIAVFPDNHFNGVVLSEK